MTMDDDKRAAALKMARTRLELLAALAEHDRAHRRTMRKCAAMIASGDDADGASLSQLLQSLGFVRTGVHIEHDTFENRESCVVVLRDTMSPEWIDRAHRALDVAVSAALRDDADGAS